MRASVIIPTYNTVTWLPAAVASALDQTHKDIEVVIVNDASTDTTAQYLEWIAKQDKRVKVINNYKNLGRSESRNVGNMQASGDIICVLDADDLATPDRVEKTITALKNADICYGNAVAMSAMGEVINEIKCEDFQLGKALDKKENGIVHSTVGYTKKVALHYPYRDGEISKIGIDDWDMQIRAAVGGAIFKRVPSVIAAYRLTSNQICAIRDNEAVLKCKSDIIEKVKCAI